ncbi:MAG: DUF1054 domain-containing protein [Streptococcaceae bacterium]|jgi:uncharacterized protein YktB (UPF0637 family)|nr:DUF1054 domain-containing protein [Streptococcaceae bacterium]
MNCFNDQTFEVFEIAGLAPRMAAIRSEIQPIFSEIMGDVAERLTAVTGQACFVHIAQHRRRTKYAPESTWSAISDHKKGYKSQAHLQLGIWPDYVFIYLAIIDNPPKRTDYANYLAAHQSFPDDFVYSLDHTKADVFPVTEGLAAGIQRLHDVKKGELEIGRIIPRDSEIWQNAPRDYILATFEALFPLYQALNETR